MFMPGITFSASRPAWAGLSSRADVALFVGCVARTGTAVPAALRSELEEGGWSPTGLFRTNAARLDALLDIPVPIESWSEFESLYDWNRRPAAPLSADMLPTALGLAVKGFFEEGGAKAYVVRTGDPLPLADPNAKTADENASRRRLLSWTDKDAPADAAERAPILPGLGDRGDGADPADPKTWRGAATIYAVSDAAMLVIPDLIDLCAGSPIPVPPVPERPGPPEQFKPCAPPAPDLAPEARAARPEYQAPRLDEAGYALWASALQFALELLGRPKGPAHRRDVMLVSAFPLPVVESRFRTRKDAGLPSSAGGFGAAEEVWPLAILDRKGIPSANGKLFDAAVIGNARLQLAYPWIETTASLNLPEGLQSPEGLLAGMVARTSLADGAFRSAAGRPCRSPRRLYPDLDESDMRRGLPGGASDWLGERLCLIGMKRGRIELVSDSTMAPDRKWRAGGVSRLMGIILRAARLFGDDLMFEPSGPRLWGRIQSTVESFLDDLWQRGALDGRSRDDAFTVDCNETSMTQADLDAGRVICRIGFTAAYPIQHINVSLLLLEAAGARAREAA
jgi:hypothetical protein